MWCTFEHLESAAIPQLWWVKREWKKNPRFSATPKAWTCDYFSALGCSLARNHGPKTCGEWVFCAVFFFRKSCKSYRPQQDNAVMPHTITRLAVQRPWPWVLVLVHGHYHYDSTMYVPVTWRQHHHYKVIHFHFQFKIFNPSALGCNTDGWGVFRVREELRGVGWGLNNN